MAPKDPLSEKKYPHHSHIAYGVARTGIPVKVLWADTEQEMAPAATLVASTESDE